jgi:hypothetical protein
MAAFDRGFKSWAERMSMSLRRELDLGPEDRLDPLRLAAHLDVVVWTPTEVPGLPGAVVHQLLERDPWVWSALSLVQVGGRGLVIHNPRHSAGRQASNIVHELSHLILDHTPGTIILSQDGRLAIRTFDRKQEEEARWLAACLLLPREGLLRARRDGQTATQIAVRYGVADTLVTYRLNMSGVEMQLGGRRRRR